MTKFMLEVMVAVLVSVLSPGRATARVDPLRAEAQASYLDVPDGPVPSTIDSGQPLTAFEPEFSAVIKDGALTSSYDEAGPAAAYFGVGLKHPVKEMGATFDFEGSANQNSAIGLIPWTSAFDSFPPAPRSSPAHVTITPVSWGIEIWEEGAFRTLHSEYFGHLRTAKEVVEMGQNLPVDGTPLEAEWQITGDTLTLTLPNGEAHSVTDPAIERSKRRGRRPSSTTTPEKALRGSPSVLGGRTRRRKNKKTRWVPRHRPRAYHPPERMQIPCRPHSKYLPPSLRPSSRRIPPSVAASASHRPSEPLGGRFEESRGGRDLRIGGPD